MKRFAIELGYGADLHGADMTKAAVRAVRDAMSRVCLAGLVEILGLKNFAGVHVHVEVAVPCPEAVDAAALAALVPIGTVSVTVVQGGLRTAGLLVERFGPDQSDIVAACAALTVSVERTE